tara:strand:+ start:21321 stop:23015 length:1695 start_codon:yes stop_codon:yes gene_type:complete
MFFSAIKQAAVLTVLAAGLSSQISAAKAPKEAMPPLEETPGLSFATNGDFEGPVSETGIPEGWQSGEEGVIQQMEEEGRAFMRLIAEKPNQLVQITQMLPLPENAKGLVVHTRFRNENVKFGKGGWLCDARARFRFYNSEGKPVGKKLNDIIFYSQAQNWSVLSRDYLVPEGADSFKINLCLNRPASGTLDIDEIKVLAMSEARFQELETARLEAEQKKQADAQKKIEDQKVIEAMLAAEPKSKQLGVYGNTLINKDREKVLLKGLNVVSLEWSPKGENIHRSIKVALKEWNANAIRLPVTDSFWFGKGKGKLKSNDAEAYRKVVDEAIRMAAGEGAYLILDLHRYGAPQEFARKFWLDAAARYANNPAVLFDLYNEPHGISWDLWRNGGEMEVKKKGKKVTVQVVGMQALVEAVRSTGARNIIIAGGTNYALDLSGILEGYALEEQPGGFGIMYATHFYNWHGGWQKHFLDIAEKYPVLVGEFGADVKKMSFISSSKQENPHTWVPDALGMVQKYQLNYTGFSMHPKATPVLIKDWSYEPTEFWGAYLKDALSGKIFELKKMR